MHPFLSDLSNQCNNVTYSTYMNIISKKCGYKLLMVNLMALKNYKNENTEKQYFNILL